MAKLAQIMLLALALTSTLAFAPSLALACADEEDVLGAGPYTPTCPPPPG